MNVQRTRPLIPSALKHYVKEDSEVDTVTQKQRFRIELFQAERDLHKASTSRDVQPFLAEEDGLLRIQRRLRNVTYDEGIKHPILLSGDHIATEPVYQKSEPT